MKAETRRLEQENDMMRLFLRHFHSRTIVPGRRRRLRVPGGGDSSRYVAPFLESAVEVLATRQNSPMQLVT